MEICLIPWYSSSSFVGKGDEFILWCVELEQIVKHSGGVHRMSNAHTRTQRAIVTGKSVQSLSCVWLCDLRDCSTPGFLVHHQVTELAQTHAHPVGDAIQPVHLLSSPSPPAFNLSQHQGLFQWVSSSHQAAKVLGFRFSISPSNVYSGLICFRMD